MEIPAEVSKNLINVHGDLGQKWLNDLPRVIQHYEEKWQLTVGACFSEACFNFVARAVLANGQNVVVKCGIPDKGFDDEMTALEHFKGHGAVQLLNADRDVGIMLLEQLTPGVLLEAHANLEDATALAVNVMQKIHQPFSGTSSFATLHDWFLGFEQLSQQFSNQTHPFPKGLVDRATQISHDLLTSMGEAVLLHGDLHYANIILS